MTIIDPPTIPTEIEGHSRQARSWQWSKAAIDFVSSDEKRIVASPAGAPLPGGPNAENEDGASTAPPQRSGPSKRALAMEPVVVPATKSGKKSLRALMHWEGVVERINGG